MERKLMTPAFHLKVLERFHAENLVGYITEKDNKLDDVTQVMKSFTLGAILETSMGHRRHLAKAYQLSTTCTDSSRTGSKTSLQPFRPQ